MYRHLVQRISNSINYEKVCGFCARMHTAQQPSEWKLATAVCLERYPVITQEKSEIEKKYHEMMTKMDIENGLLSQHEEELERDRKYVQEQKEIALEEGISMAGKKDSQVTRMDLEDQWDSEYDAYTFPSRTTEADKKNDMKSTKRKLDRKLILIVQKTFFGKPTWILPEKFYNNEETLKKTAENLLQNYGPNFKSGIFSNAPHGFYKYKFPSTVAEAEGKKGAKIFIYKAEFLGGNVEISDENIKDYKWVTLDELPEYLKPEYYKSLKQFVLEY